MLKANSLLHYRQAFSAVLRHQDTKDRKRQSRDKGTGIAILLLAFLVFAISLLSASISMAQTFQWPVVSPNVTQYYSHYNTTYGKYHAGMDITSATGNTAVYATESGTVRRIDNGIYINENHNMGNVVIIDHSNGMFSLYAHLASINVANGQYVNKGTQIGIMGNTGTGGGGVHLHFEVKAWEVLGNLDDDLGPYWGYTTPEKPNWYGYINPYPYLEYNINNISLSPIRVTTNQPLRTGPGTDYTDTFGTVSTGQQFVAFSEYNGWYQIYIPSSYGPATGWIQGAIESSAIQAEVNDPARGIIGVNVRDNPTTSNSNTITYVWDKQRLVVLDQSSGLGCSNLWYKIYLPDGFSSLTGWVCGDYLSVSTPPDTTPPTTSITGGPSGPITYNLN